MHARTNTRRAIIGCGETYLSESTNEDAWFYAQGGQRKGPVPADKLRELLAAQTIDGETPIWRKGLADWQPLRATDIGAQLKDTPPAIATNQINNGLVWALALAPIGYLFFEVILIGYQNSHPENATFFEAFLEPLSWIVPVTVNAVLCLVDAEQLKRAGYSSSWMTLFALLLAPIYLFVRANRLRQMPTYGFVWIASFLVTIILRAL